MADIISRTNNLDRVLLVIFSLLLLVPKGNAYEFVVGGSKGWSVPTDSNATSYNMWAESKRFSIGDTISFVYPADKDSVLLVTPEDYANCSTESPIEKFTDGHTQFKFNHSGPHYFISGVKEHCEKNEKLEVVVLADRSNHGNSTETYANSPPSPAPASEESPPPPSGMVEINPTPAPTAETPPPSGGASITMSLVSIAGAFAGSSLLLAF
ncbi:hypothetical protein RJ639_047261 [Escallonia herrerae]|uniref:Phytocyanin domain-containing protein n=1 Tax=Escallonia herrerae TaxID=1293975 RepID=A0AA89AZD0_9ASTE|nr:hypothetical protein RJ639_047261 [Escallonia herrerae]